MTTCQDFGSGHNGALTAHSDHDHHDEHEEGGLLTLPCVASTICSKPLRPWLFSRDCAASLRSIDRA